MASNVDASTHSGSLTIARSGIASIGQITLETLSHIKDADSIFYVIPDPATEAFIKNNAKGTTFDLCVFYDQDKSRYDTYVQMSEVMLNDVRKGLSVLGIFYGHPGIFVTSSHRAIAIARKEGYKARMLPGVSAEDCLFADLGVDPSTQGCVSYEATDILMRNTGLNPTSHNIIWQVGLIGVDTMVFDNAKFHLLVDRLEKDFGSDHVVVHYIAAVLPQSKVTMDVYTVADLRKEDVVKQIRTPSTFYIPPRDDGSYSEDTIKKLNIPERDESVQAVYPPPAWARTASRTVDPYGLSEQRSVSELKTHTAPKDHTVLHNSPAMTKFMTDLALNPRFLAQYSADRVSTVAAVEGLRPQEQVALRSGNEAAIYAVMKARPDDIAQGRLLSAEEIEQGISNPAKLFRTAAASPNVVQTSFFSTANSPPSAPGFKVFSANAPPNAPPGMRVIYR